MAKQRTVRVREPEGDWYRGFLEEFPAAPTPEGLRLDVTLYVHPDGRGHLWVGEGEAQRGYRLTSAEYAAGILWRLYLVAMERARPRPEGA